MRERASMPLPTNQLAFEQAVMEEICAQAGVVGDILRQQYRSAVVTDRYGSGAGFFTTYDVPADIVRIPQDKCDASYQTFFEMKGVGDADLRSADGYNLMMCHLCLWNDGRINFLECVSFGGGIWPEAWYSGETWVPRRE